MINNPLVSILIVTWNRKEEVLKALTSCYEQTYKNIEIVIVDNNSSDGTEQAIKEKYQNIKYIKTHKNIGCPPARNIGLANCDGDIIYSLDDDGWLEDNCIDLVVSEFLKSENKNIGVISTKIIDPNTGEIQGNNFDNTRIVPRFSGGAFAIKQNVLKEVGVFPDYFRQMEETYLAMKIFDAGYKVLFIPEAIMYHYKSPKGRDNYQITYLNFKHEIENIRKLFSLRNTLFLIGYKFFAHFRAYLRGGFILKYPIDFIKVFSLCFENFHEKKLEKQKETINEFFLINNINILFKV